MSVSELADILTEHLNVVFTSEVDRQCYESLKFWLIQPDLDDAKVVCANVELVRFGAVYARPSQSKKSADTCPLTLSDPKDLKKMLTRAKIVDTMMVSRYPDTVENRAQMIGSFISPDTKRPVNAKMSSMCYITVRDLLKCIAHGRNTTTLNEFCMYYTAAMQIYLTISISGKYFHESGL